VPPCRRLAAAPQPAIGSSMKAGAASQGSHTGARRQTAVRQGGILEGDRMQDSGDNAGSR